VNEKLQQMRDTGKFDAYYFERKPSGSNIKKLIEEVIPISRLCLYLSTPASEVYATCFTGNQNYDAIIEVTGFNPRRFKLEVTTTENDSSVLRRHALARYGHVSLTGSIRRQGREIIEEPEMISVDEEDQECIDRMLQRLREKIDYGRYDDDTVFLVFMTDFRPIGMYHRARLIQQTENYLYEVEARTPGVYYCYTADYSIDSVHIPNSKWGAVR
jgi:hypothetical protein